MEYKNVNHVDRVPVEEVCSVCEIPGHPMKECPTLPVLKEVLHDQANTANTFSKPYNNPYTNTYNLG